MTKDRFAALSTLGKPAVREQPEAEPRRTPAQPTQDLKTLGARLPLEITQEFARRKLDAEADAQLRKVTSEVGLEALVRLLRISDVRELWYAELVKVIDGQD